MKLAFIGMGNMGTALLRGFLASGRVTSAGVVALGPATDMLTATAAELGFSVAATAALLA